VDGILSFQIPEEKEDYTIPILPADMDIDIDPQLSDSANNIKATSAPVKSNLRLPPPPLFSRQAVPQLYKLSCFCSFRRVCH
jgi:general transcription factor 3C polypeptide 5 (transcription factor C subunit 1)